MTISFKRTASTLGLLAATSMALVACNEGGQAAGGANGEAAGTQSDVSGNLVGEGASSQQNAMDVFGVAFNTATGGNANLSYTASGSGAGQKAFLGGQAAFAGSDSPLDEEQQAQANERCGGNEAWNLPMVIGPVAIAYNLEGVDELNLSVETVAQIFKGEITKWNDDAIAAENEGVELPDKDIQVIYRSDESGTSENFQKFLAASTGSWDSEGKAFPQAVGTGANGSSGVATEVSGNDGAITYVESGFANDMGLGVANIDFGNGPVALNNDSVVKTLDNLEFTTEGNNMVVDAEKLFASDAEGAYPLILTTYEIVCSAGYDEETQKLVKAFMQTILDNQNADLESRGYVPVSGAHLERLQAAVDAL